MPLVAQHALQAWPNMSPASIKQPEAAAPLISAMSAAVGPADGLAGVIARAEASDNEPKGSPKSISQFAIQSTCHSALG